MPARLERQDGSPVCERCLLAETPLTRLRGLLGRAGLERGEGLYLRPASSIHTWFMRFPIDAVFVDREDRVLKIVRELRPWRLSGCRRASAVVELPAGECDRVGLREGEQLVLVREPARAPAARVA
ncbi:MAG TPA: DUF192 domain-containing protein [Gaiellaceae bacterium]|nr:DUF192 domain-containing protein [Gaiellaceae bacterium]